MKIGLDIENVGHAKIIGPMKCLLLNIPPKNANIKLFAFIEEDENREEHIIHHITASSSFQHYLLCKILDGLHKTNYCFYSVNKVHLCALILTKHGLTKLYWGSEWLQKYAKSN